VADQSVPVLRPVTLNDSSDRKQLFRGTGARRVRVARPDDPVQLAALITGGWNMHALPLTK
ncbi:MAG: hypothetical protein ACKVQU_02950, partial [Burkholderiales bacterium]